MPYKSLDEANPAIKGIKPPVTLAQANAIAAAADAIDAQGGADNPWATAIASFKKSNEVKDGAWVKKGGKAEAAAITADPVVDAAVEPTGDTPPAEKPKAEPPAGSKAKPTPDSLRVEVMPLEKFDPVTLELVDVDPGQGISAVVGNAVKWAEGDPKMVHTYVFTGDAWAEASAAKWVKKKGAKRGKDWQSGPDGAAPGGDGADTATDTPAPDAAPIESDRDAHRRLGGKHEHSLAEIRLLIKKTQRLLDEVQNVKPIIAKPRLTECEGEDGHVDDEDGHDDGDEFAMPAPLAGVTSYADLENRQAADTTQEELKKLVYFFPQLASEILRKVVDEKGQPLDAQARVAMLKNLADEFVKLAGEALTNAPELAPAPEASGAPAEAATSGRTGERLAESSTVTFTDADPDATLLAEAGTPGASKPLRMLVNLIQPGWGNTTDNHYYPAEMLRACAEKFVGRKMYETDHRDSEKSTRTWVSTITAIHGFSPEGAPVAEVVAHDPGFADRVRNLDQANLLDKMECSILADGTAAPDFEEGGRKGKKVTEITSVESVDWVTRAGAGGHAAELAESQKGAKPMSAKLTATVISAMVDASRLPAAARTRLLEGAYPDEAALQGAIDRERVYIKQITGSGQPFGNAPAPVPAPLSEADLNKAKDAVIARYFPGR